MKITFVDYNCPAPYDDLVMAEQAMGGTESTIIRVARALAERHEVLVLQHCRQSLFHSATGVLYAPMAEWREKAAGSRHLIFIQKAQHVATMVTQLRNARLWLWMHNFVPRDYPLFWADHLRFRMTLICVSKTHQAATGQYLRQHALNRATLGWVARGGVEFQYNPLDPQWLVPPVELRDPHKLVFFSSPHKGLEQVLEAFAIAHRRDSRWRLYVADPGYQTKAELPSLNHPGVVRLGKLNQAALRQHVSQAFCVFYPQTVWAETFGLVYAESNAAGTPVLAHNFGAAREVLDPCNPPFDDLDAQRAVSVLEAWRDKGAPAVAMNPNFTIAAVAQGWQRMLDAHS